MSTDTNQQTDTEAQADELRDACDRLDAVAREHGGSVDAVLRDVEHVLETVAVVLEEENGEITREELADRVYPTGGANG